jgi:GTP-binding protein LepA
MHIHDMQNIRNFLITAHIDHGKSTLADRMLEITKTIEQRNMQAQFLDTMDLERERGITIKMTPVRMEYPLNGKDYILNLIDTPGHSDFGYEVSRALAAVEGAILLVDATQGVQAQTLYNYEMARKAGLTIIGAINKIDVATPEQAEAAMTEISILLGIEPEEILKVSGKTGEGVPALLAAVIERIPAPKEVTFGKTAARGLIFDSQYDEHRGVIAYIRVFSGEFKLNTTYHMVATGGEVRTKDIGYLKPKLVAGSVIHNGEIGYIATGIKDPDLVKIGDTISDVRATTQTDQLELALPGYREPRPVVFVSFYPEHPEDYDEFKKALAKLRLSDSAIRFEPDASEVLGRGFKGGFLGKLHFEIAAERLDREFDIPVVSSFPSVAYKVKLSPRTLGTAKQKELEPAFVELAGGKQGAREEDTYWIKNPKDFPSDALVVYEPMTAIEILTPMQYLGPILQLKELYRFRDITTETIGASNSGRMVIKARLPLADLISDFDDKLKSVSQGYGSLSYEVVDYEKGDVDKLEFLVAENLVPGLTRILPRAEIETEARATCAKLKDLLPKQQFKQAIQAQHRGRVIARETVVAESKELGNFGKNGGDRTRKMKLWKKQARGKERLEERSTNTGVRISASIFKELLKK